jgi:hypothetical protein
MVRSKNAGKSSEDELFDKDVGVFDVTLLADEFDENRAAFSVETFDVVVVDVFDENRAASTSISIQSFWNDSRSPK